MSDIVTTRIFTDGEKGISAQKLNDIVGSSVIQPDFVASKPLASTVDPADNLLVLKAAGTYARAPFSTITSSAAGQIPLADATQNGMLRQVSGLATDVVDGTNHCVPVAGMAGITQMRLRSYSSIGNPNFEVDQRNVGGSSVVAANTFALDRWLAAKAGTLTATVQQIASSGSGALSLPGTSFGITSKVLRITLTAQQASLGATDKLFINQFIEGPQLRELINDVHSISILCRSSVAGLKFGVSLRDSTANYSLTSLCTLGAAATWTLITIPNLPVFTALGSFPIAPGGVGYTLFISLAGGSSQTSSSNGVWIAGNYTAANGQDNFANNANGSTFDIAFVQHEPGLLCTTLIDKPFSTNLNEAMRYFQKSYDYNVAPTTLVANGITGGSSIGAAVQIRPGAIFPIRMAKAPTVTIYAPTVSGSNIASNMTAATNPAVTAANIGESGYILNANTAPAGSSTWQWHYTADTGW